MTKSIRLLRSTKGQFPSYKPRTPPDVRIRAFHVSHAKYAIRPYILSDPGEGIKEVQIIQWFVQPGARVEQFDKVCEVASDKANIEITSRYDGVIKQLHHQQDDIVQVGTALLDIDVQGETAVTLDPVQQAVPEPLSAVSESIVAEMVTPPALQEGKYRHSNLATPAVRGLIKQHDITIEQICGTGKDGRVTKEDVYRHLASAAQPRDAAEPAVIGASQDQFQHSSGGADTSKAPIPLTANQQQMFKAMTRSLQIPQFVYGDEIDITKLSALRRRLNTQAPPSTPKLSLLHFIIKALSQTLNKHPHFNAQLVIPDSENVAKAYLQPLKEHNIGMAIDTPQGLFVPNIKNVAAKSLLEIAASCRRLQDSALAKDSTTAPLTSYDLKHGTITVSNIGNIGGTYLAPTLVPGELAILGIGRARTIPAFESAATGNGKVDTVVRREVVNFSWTADHRVIDGAKMARMANCLKEFVEDPERMLLHLS